MFGRCDQEEISKRVFDVVSDVMLCGGESSLFGSLQSVRAAGESCGGGLQVQEAQAVRLHRPPPTHLFSPQRCRTSSLQSRKRGDMAAPFKRWGSRTLNCSSRIPQRARAPRIQTWQRLLSSSAPRRADDSKKPPADGDDWITDQLPATTNLNVDETTKYQAIEKPEVKGEVKAGAVKVDAVAKEQKESTPSDSSTKEQSTKKTTKQLPQEQIKTEEPKATAKKGSAPPTPPHQSQL